MTRLPIVDFRTMEKVLLREIDLTPDQFRQELDQL